MTGTCKICGEELEFVPCEDCDGEGFSDACHDCGEDTCGCADPDPGDCMSCGGTGGLWLCPNAPHTVRKGDKTK